MKGDDDETWDEHETFQGECTCEHDYDSHGRGACGIDDCTCKAGWED